MFELSYIHHDCFFLKTREIAVVFDFWFDPLQKSGERLPRFLKDLPKTTPLYVLVSHFHKDHFNRKIFNWADSFSNIKFVVSKDVSMRIKYLLKPDSTYKGKKLDSDKLIVLSKFDSYADENLNIDCFGSTDIGNSYALTLYNSGLRVFHAGDLNCWSWRDESTPREIEEAENLYLQELKPIVEKYPEFDVVMFPVDSRIGTGYNEGAKIFLNSIKVKRFFPMHFSLGDNEQELVERRIDALKTEDYSSFSGEFIGLTNPYDLYADSCGNSNDTGESFNEHTGTWFLSAGDANAEHELSLPTLMLRLIDIATKHANILKIGNPYMPESNMGWVLSRACIDMEQFPVADSTYSISTWIESWNRHFSERAFRIFDSMGKTLGYARQIWMVLDTKTRTNAGLDGLSLPEGYRSECKCPIARQGKHFQMLLPDETDGTDRRIKVAESSPKEYTFSYSDLDAYRHVNTVMYVRLLMNQFSLRQHDESKISRIELSFLDEGAYGMTVDILKGAVTERNDKNQEISDFLLRDHSTKAPVLYSRIFLSPRR